MAITHPLSTFAALKPVKTEELSHLRCEIGFHSCEWKDVLHDDDDDPFLGLTPLSSSGS